MDVVAVIFGGQGTQQYLDNDFPKDLIPKNIYNNIQKKYGIDMYQLLSRKNVNEIMSPLNSHLATYCYNVSIYEYLRQLEVFDPSFFAGHSLGEFNARVASGCIDAISCADLVYARGKIVEDAQEEGCMVALLGVPYDKCRKIAGEHHVDIANINSKFEVVLAGPTKNIEKVIEHLKENKIKHVKLSVSHPFHTRFMVKPAREFGNYLEVSPFHSPRIPLAQNASGKISSTSDEVLHNLSMHMSSPVRWMDCIQTLISHGVTHFVEIAPKSVLSAMVKTANWKLKTSFFNHKNISELHLD